MASQTLSNVKILLRNDTAANWTTKNTVLGKGEMGIEIDTGKFKFGDGTTVWGSLGYAGTVVSASATNGHINIDGTDTTVYTLPVGATVIGGVKTTASGAGTVAIDSVGAMALNNSGVTAGTYTKLTVGASGVVTAATDITADDVPTLTIAKISDAGTAASKDVGTSSGNVPILNANGKLDSTIIPAVAITDVYPAESEAAMLALSAEKGDMCVRSDTNQVFILANTPASTLANWVQINVPSGGVTSINGKTGVVVLTTTDIAEGTNLYYTEARFNTAFATKNSTDLADSSTLLRNTDTYIIDGGNA